MCYVYYSQTEQQHQKDTVPASGVYVLSNENGEFVMICKPTCQQRRQQGHEPFEQAETAT